MRWLRETPLRPSASLVMLRRLSGSASARDASSANAAAASESLPSSVASLSLGTEETLCFLSHHHASGGAAARHLSERLCDMLQVPPSRVFLDSDALKDLRDLLSRHVASTRVLVLIQTAEALTRPFVLAEVYTAIKRGIPIVPVNLTGGNYDYARVRDFLTAADFADRLEQASAGSVDALVKLNIRPQELGALLADTLPSLLSFSLGLKEPKKVLEAQVEIIAEEIVKAAKKHRPVQREKVKTVGDRVEEMANVFSKLDIDRESAMAYAKVLVEEGYAARTVVRDVLESTLRDKVRVKEGHLLAVMQAQKQVKERAMEPPSAMDGKAAFARLLRLKGVRTWVHESSTLSGSAPGLSFVGEGNQLTVGFMLIDLKTGHKKSLESEDDAVINVRRENPDTKQLEKLRAKGTPAFSADGRFGVCNVGGGWFLWDHTTGKAIAHDLERRCGNVKWLSASTFIVLGSVLIETGQRDNMKRSVKSLKKELVSIDVSDPRRVSMNYIVTPNIDINCLSVSPSGQRFAAIGEGGDKEIIIWSRSSPEPNVRVWGAGAVARVIFSSTDDRFITVSGQLLSCWSIEGSGDDPLWSRPFNANDANAANAASFTPDDRHLVVLDTRARLLDSDTGAELGAFVGTKEDSQSYRRELTSIAFSANGRFMAMIARTNHISNNFWCETVELWSREI